MDVVEGERAAGVVSARWLSQRFSISVQVRLNNEEGGTLRWVFCPMYELRRVEMASACSVR
jgi:hypothetical protein